MIRRLRKISVLSMDFSSQFLLRLSAVVAAELTNNNPNIADLSDDNRPTKLSDRFSELYDNEWTEAFIALEETLKDLDMDGIYNVEKEIIFGLLKMLTVSNVPVSFL